MFKNKTKKVLAGLAVASTAVVSTTATAAGIGDITSNIDLSGATAGIIAVGVAIGGLLVVAIGVRYVVGFLKRA
ncbi:major capsid protein [Pasteurella multocida]|nr:major capsid protein [Pasteurella multocida]MDY0485037.1 major capsid protein [Pasteurella multocida]MDY0534386.1 major capsid protein [Pasteurella multocida]MDY0537128.1 major capsid protein [Pasteurella multocida]MDY0555072.1 major capsid protein [Pasteurella multocida]